MVKTSAKGVCTPSCWHSHRCASRKHDANDAPRSSLMAVTSASWCGSSLHVRPWVSVLVLNSFLTLWKPLSSFATIVFLLRNVNGLWCNCPPMSRKFSVSLHSIIDSLMANIHLVSSSAWNPVSDGSINSFSSRFASVRSSCKPENKIAGFNGKPWRGL